jgi:hypothetical protein
LTSEEEAIEFNLLFNLRLICSSDCRTIVEREEHSKEKIALWGREQQKMAESNANPDTEENVLHAFRQPHHAQRRIFSL